MSENESAITVETAQQKNQKLILNIIRTSGVVFILVAIGALSDAGGIASGIYKDSTVRMTFGGSLCFVGLMDIFIVPLIIKKGWAKAEASKNSN